MLDALNNWFIFIIDQVLALWPSTPAAFKLSTLLAGPMTAFPMAPWYLLGQALSFATWVFGAVAGIKAFKIIWP